jgi:hypothetical protein
MMYAFARDGGIPGHQFFNKVDCRWKSPIRTGECPDLKGLGNVEDFSSLAGVYVELPAWVAKSWKHR